MNGINTTLCYLKRGEEYLMLHRVKKEGDLNKDKWIGIGGKFEAGESPEDCLCREVLEETDSPCTAGGTGGLSPLYRTSTAPNICTSLTRRTSPGRSRTATRGIWSGFTGDA